MGEVALTVTQWKLALGGGRRGRRAGNLSCGREKSDDFDKTASGQMMRLSGRNMDSVQSGENSMMSAQEKMEKKERIYRTLAKRFFENYRALAERKAMQAKKQ